MSAVADKLDTFTKTVSSKLSKLDEIDKRTTDMDALLKKHHEALSRPLYLGGATPTSVFAQARDRKEEGKWGYKSLNHQLWEIKEASRNPQKAAAMEAHLRKAAEEWMKGLPPEYLIKAGQGLSEAVGPDGGFLLAPTFAEGVLEIVHKEENLLERCDKYEMAGPSLKIRAIDETSRVTGSRWGGVQGYWVDEGSGLTPSKPKFRLIEISPHKLATLFYATDELIADGGNMLEQMTSRIMAKEINFLIGLAIIRGTGAGQPLGVLNSAATISVAKRPGQAAATVITENITDMWSRLHLSAHQNACWFIHQDVTGLLPLMTLGVGLAGVVTYMPPGGVSGLPYATLQGRPVVITEFNSTVGTVGDIILADLKAYIAATRGTIQAASSIHVAFLTDETAFRLTMRVDGQPWWRLPLTPFLGTNTQSPFITLQTRA